MPAERAGDIASRFRPVEIPRNGALLKAGEVNDRYLFLMSGRMRSFSHDPEGGEVTTAFHAPGQVVFDVHSFFERTPSLENIVALSDVTGMESSFAEMNGMFHAYPEFREFGRRILVMGFVELKKRMQFMISSTAEERYAELLRNDPELFQHAPLKQIASYLGITDTSLSRIRKELVRR
jgi:CRP-like cAMP-binding protein